MNAKIFASLIGKLVPALIALLPNDVLKRAIDALLDKIEEAVKESRTPIDDAVVLPLCALIRSTMSIPGAD